MPIQHGKKRHPIDRQITDRYFHLNEYLIEMTTVLDKKVAELDEYEKEQIKEGNYWSVPEYIQEMYGEAFVNILYNSTFIAGYGLFESTLKKYCQLAKEITGKEMRKRKDKESYILQFHNYLQNQVGIDLSSMQGDFDSLEEAGKIRNCFTHQQGNVYDKPDKPITEQKAYKAAINHSDLEFNQSTGDVKIKSGSYVQHFAMQSKAYLDYVIDNILALKNS
jgi:hypothetical protein